MADPFTGISFTYCNYIDELQSIDLEVTTPSKYSASSDKSVTPLKTTKCKTEGTPEADINN